MQQDVIDAHYSSDRTAMGMGHRDIMGIYDQGPRAVNHSITAALGEARSAN